MEAPCTPDRIRTGATAVRGRRARPLHNGGEVVLVLLVSNLRNSSEPLTSNQVGAFGAPISLGY